MNLNHRFWGTPNICISQMLRRIRPIRSSASGRSRDSQVSSVPCSSQPRRSSGRVKRAGLPTKALRVGNWGYTMLY